jgi:putative tryptophan/tyrosine transport system substrate-binding protein
LLFAVCSSAAAQQTGKVFRIGYLDPSTAPGSAVLVEAFQQELRKLGWIEGKDFTIVYRFGENKPGPGRLHELAADLVRLKVDVIVASGGSTPLAAKTVTSTIPIVMTNTGDPVSQGLVASLARPKGNVTGNASLSPELNTKRLEILKDVVPKLAGVGYLQGQGGSVLADLQLNELRAAAVALKLKLEEIKTEPNAKRLRERLSNRKAETGGRDYHVYRQPLFRREKADRRACRQIPVAANYPQKEYVDEGGLMSYGVDYTAQFRRAAVYVDKILKGAKPADLPVQQATKFEFIINLKAAKQIELTIPVQVLERANKVIK